MSTAVDTEHQSRPKLSVAPLERACSYDIGPGYCPSLAEDVLIFRRGVGTPSLELRRGYRSEQYRASKNPWKERFVLRCRSIRQRVFHFNGGELL